PRNNVEQLVYVPSAQQMVVKVYREAGFGPDQEEPFGIAFSQPVTPAAGPKLGIACLPKVDPLTQVVSLGCVATNTGDLPLFGLTVTPSGGLKCQGIDATKPLNPNWSAACTIACAGAAPITINASGTLADETFAASTISGPPPAIDCHGVTLNPAQVTAG